MKKNNPVKSFIFFNRSGCLLPVLMVLNLFFGWIFFRPGYWLILEAALFLLFLMNMRIAMRKVFPHASGRDGAVDVEGRVLKDDEGDIAKTG